MPSRRRQSSGYPMSGGAKSWVRSSVWPVAGKTYSNPRLPTTWVHGSLHSRFRRDGSSPMPCLSRRPERCAGSNFATPSSVTDCGSSEPMTTAMQDIDARRAALRAAFPTWTATTLHGRLDECAASFGSRPLVLCDDATLTYDDVVEQSRCLAAGFVELGVRPGDRVGVVMANYPEFVPIKFAISRVGAIAVPFNFLYKQDDLAYVLADSGCRVLVTMTGFGGLDYPSMLDAIAPGWDDAEYPNRQTLAEDPLPALRHVVLLETDGPCRAGIHSVRSLLELGSEHLCAVSGIVVDPHAPADILYTSGTTGTPKGVITSHDAVLRTAYASALTRAFEDGRRILFSLPCYHMFGYVEGLLSVLYVGGAIIPLVKFSAERY